MTSHLQGRSRTPHLQNPSSEPQRVSPAPPSSLRPSIHDPLFLSVDGRDDRRSLLDELNHGGGRRASPAPSPPAAACECEHVLPVVTACFDHWAAKSVQPDLDCGAGACDHGLKPYKPAGRLAEHFETQIGNLGGLSRCRVVREDPKRCGHDRLPGETLRLISSLLIRRRRRFGRFPIIGIQFCLATPGFVPLTCLQGPVAHFRISVWRIRHARNLLKRGGTWHRRLSR